MTNSSKLEEYEKACSIHPQDYFGIINDLMAEGFSNGMFSKHRDSDQLQISNFETAKQSLLNDFEAVGWDYDDEGNDIPKGDIAVESSSHWAVGWVETIHVRMRDEVGEFTDAFEAACALLDRLEEYPVLDEFDYSKRENEELMDYLSDEVGNEYADSLARYLFDIHSISRVEDVRHEWIEEWRQENILVKEEE